MNQKQDNLTTMFETTLTFLDNHAGTWNKMPAFTDAVTRAREGTAQIRNRVGHQQSPTVGITEDKAQVRDDLEERLIVIADAIAAFAANTHDHDLAARVEMTKSSIDRLPESDLIQAAERVVAAANSNLGALAPFGVTDANKKELGDAATLFANKKESPREAVIGRKVDTLSLPAAISSVRSIFRNEIDKLMTAFRKPNPDFYNGYFAARIIVDRAATHPPKNPEPPPKP